MPYCGGESSTGALCGQQPFNSPAETDSAASAREAAGKPRLPDDSRVREVVAILGMVLLADLVIYRGHGYAGLAVFLLFAPGLLLFGKPRPQIRASLWVVGGMLTLLAARLLWYGSPLQVILGFALVIAFVTSLDGRKPFLLDVLATAAQAIVSGCRSLWGHLHTLRHRGASLRRRRMLNIVLPAGAFLLFSTLFVLANPDAVTFVGRQMQRTLNAVRDWFARAARGGRVSRPPPAMTLECRH